MRWSTGRGGAVAGLALAAMLVVGACGGGTHGASTTTTPSTTVGPAKKPSPASTTTSTTVPESTTSTVAPAPVTTTAPPLPTTTAPAVTTTTLAVDYATEARDDAGSACSVLSTFDETQLAAVRASRAQGGNETADEGVGAPAAAAAAYGDASDARKVATAHLAGDQGGVWDQFALTFALLDASEGGDPGNGITSATDHATSSTDYGAVGQLCEGDFGTSFPTLSL